MQLGLCRGPAWQEKSQAGGIWGLGGGAGAVWAHRGHSCHLSQVLSHAPSPAHRCHLSPVPAGMGGRCCGQDADPSFLPHSASQLQHCFSIGKKKTQTEPRGLSILHNNSSSPSPCHASQTPPAVPESRNLGDPPTLQGCSNARRKQTEHYEKGGNSD